MAKQMIDNAEQEQESNGGGSGRGPRSPNFPGISLPDAIAKARILYDKDKRATVSVKTALKHFGFGEKLSGSSARVISALRQFGLIDDIGGNYRVSDAAYHIIALSDGAPKRLEAIQACVRKPAIYREVLKHYPDGLPSDDAVKDFLITDKKFNPASVDTFLRVFKASLAFAKVGDGAYTGRVENNGQPSVNVGDFVEWESQGVLQFESRRVVGLSDDGVFAFVEGSATGIPMEQLQKVDPPPGGSVTPPPPFKPLVNPGTLREVSNLEKGEVVLQWPMEISAAEVDEIQEWLTLVMKKMKRRYAGETK